MNSGLKRLTELEKLIPRPPCAHAASRISDDAAEIARLVKEIETCSTCQTKETDCALILDLSARHRLPASPEHGRRLIEWEVGKSAQNILNSSTTARKSICAVRADYCR